MSTTLFYAYHCGTEPTPRPDLIDIDAVWWRPRFGSKSPDGRRRLVYGVWWLFHHLRVFRNQSYRVLMMRREGEVVHRSMVFPGFFRFPFMSSDDLQIGDTLTEPRERGRGLATLALRTVTHDLWKPGRTFWYLVEEDNEPSIRAVEKAGFQLAGRGAKEPRFGVRFLGAYRMA